MAKIPVPMPSRTILIVDSFAKKKMEVTDRQSRTEEVTLIPTSLA